jgi:hypothetical protein
MSRAQLIRGSHRIVSMDHSSRVIPEVGVAPNKGIKRMADATAYAQSHWPSHSGKLSHLTDTICKSWRQEKCEWQELRWCCYPSF